MTNDKLTVFIIGVAATVLVYGLVKVLQWRKSSSSQFPEPRRRSDAGKAAAPVSMLSAGNASPPVAAPQASASRLPPYSPAAVTNDSVEEDFPYADGSDYVFGRITPVLAALLPTTADGRKNMTRVLRNAGHYSLHAWHNFAAVRYLTLMLPVLFFLSLLLVVPSELEWLVMCGVVIGPVIGWALPGLLVRNKATERLRDIENGMPDMLDLLNMCVSQGMTLPAALGRIGTDLEPVYPALGKELKIVNEQARVGSLPQALKNFSTRVDVPEVHSFTSLLTQTERMGTSVSESLLDYSDSMRETMRQRADEKANTAAFKLLFPTVMFLMPAVFLFLSGPAIIELNRFYTQGGADSLNATDQIRQFTITETPLTAE